MLWRTRNMSNSRRESSFAKTPSALANIESLIDGRGDITIGRFGSLPCVATAADEEQCLAMLQRRPSESLLDLLQRLDAQRLDAAIEYAFENGVHIDEVSSPPRPKPAGGSRT